LNSLSDPAPGPDCNRIAAIPRRVTGNDDTS
jgi:hypothetical protein